MILNFRKFLIESAWGSSMKYNLPKDKEQRLYDFYMMTFLGNNKKPQKGVKEDEASQMEHVLYEVKSKLYPKLKNSLLEAVFYSISCELRHARDENSLIHLANHLRNHHPWQDEEDDEDINQYKQHLNYSKGKTYEKMFKKFITTYSSWSGAADYQKKHKATRKSFENEMQNSGSYYSAYQGALAAANGDQKSFIEMALILFGDENVDWEDGYGGDAWAGICRGWLKLNEANDLNYMQVWIDHIYDLQHNNGSVLNKLKSYYKGDTGGYRWLAKALDHKKEIEDVHELLNFVSPAMKTIAARALKIQTGRTLEDFNKDGTPTAISIFTPYQLQQFDTMTLLYGPGSGSPESCIARICLNKINGNAEKISNDEYKKWINSLIKRSIKKTDLYTQNFNVNETIKMIKNDIKFIFDKKTSRMLSIPGNVMDSIKENFSKYASFKPELKELLVENLLLDPWIVSAIEGKMNLLIHRKEYDMNIINSLQEMWKQMSDPKRCGSTYDMIIRLVAKFIYNYGTESTVKYRPELSKTISEIILSSSDDNSTYVDILIRNGEKEYKALVTILNNLSSFDHRQIRTTSLEDLKNMTQNIELLSIGDCFNDLNYPQRKMLDCVKLVRDRTNYDLLWCKSLVVFHIITKALNNPGYYLTLPELVPEKPELSNVIIKGLKDKDQGKTVADLTKSYFPDAQS